MGAGVCFRGGQDANFEHDAAGTAQGAAPSNGERSWGQRMTVFLEFLDAWSYRLPIGRSIVIKVNVAVEQILAALHTYIPNTNERQGRPDVRHRSKWANGDLNVASRSSTNPLVPRLRQQQGSAASKKGAPTPNLSPSRSLAQGANGPGDPRQSAATNDALGGQRDWLGELQGGIQPGKS
jgi:hypothetical protein